MFEEVTFLGTAKKYHSVEDRTINSSKENRLIYSFVRLIDLVEHFQRSRRNLKLILTVIQVAVSKKSFTELPQICPTRVST